MSIQQVCLGCHRLTSNGSRCESCEARRQSVRYQTRAHYRGDYARRARMVRHAAQADPLTQCWLCGEHARADDPWTADHVTPGDPSSVLMPAHRSCNASRGDATGKRREHSLGLEKR